MQRCDSFLSPKYPIPVSFTGFHKYGLEMVCINYISIKLEKYGLELQLRQGLGFQLVCEVRSRKTVVLNQG